MKKRLFTLASLMLAFTATTAQEVNFEEYKLDNGMHVILHQDNTAPVVTTSVMYHVGAKDENPQPLFTGNRHDGFAFSLRAGRQPASGQPASGQQHRQSLGCACS